MRSGILSLVLLLLCVEAGAQFYSTGSDPLLLHWRRLERPLWRIEADSAALGWAQKADQELQRIVPLTYSDFPLTRQRRVDVVVHSRTAYSNGLVAWAPKRLEAYAYDNAQDDCVPWVQHLMAHEYRHVAQMQTTVYHFSRFMAGLFGQQFLGLEVGAFVPNWALEGDAVWAETRYTAGGRGRRGDFLQQMRAQSLQGRTPSYGQAYFGSYRRRLPDYYHMGYYIVSATERGFGRNPIPGALLRVGRQPFSFVPFNRELHLQMGMRKMSLYKWSLSQWGQQWQQEAQARAPRLTAQETVAAPRRDYEELTSPHPLGASPADGLVCYSTAPWHTPRFVLLRPGRRPQTVAKPTPRDEEQFAFAAGTLVWSERRQNPRWGQASRSVLMLQSLDGGRKRRLTRGGNYHSPDLNADGSGLCAIHVDQGLRCHLVTWDLSSCPKIYGRELERRATEWKSWPVGTQASDVRWLDADHLLVVVVDGRGKSILSVDRAGVATTLLGPLTSNIRNPSVSRGEVWFAMDTEGYLDLYSLSLSDGTLRRRVTAEQGADWPRMTDEGLLYSSYDANGYRIALSALPDSATMTCVQPTAFALECDSSNASGRGATERKIGPMRVHLLPNIHSWGPIGVDVGNQEVTPGLSVSSQNTHGTTTLQAGVNLGDEYREERWYVRAAWDWLWPHLEVNARWGRERHLEAMLKTGATSGDEEADFKMLLRTDCSTRLARLTALCSVPLAWHVGPLTLATTPFLAFNWEHHRGADWQVDRLLFYPNGYVVNLGDYDYSDSDDRYTTMTASLGFRLTQRPADRDVGPRLGFALQGYYDFSPLGLDHGRQLTGTATVYLPGFARHHQIALTGQAAKAWTGDMYISAGALFSYRMLTSRVPQPTTLVKYNTERQMLLRAQYTLPLANPDWQWGPLLYWKRIYLKAFYDVGFNKRYDFQGGGWLRRSVVGGDVYADLRVLSLPYPVTLGVRVAWRPELHNTVCRLLLAASLGK